MAQAQKDVDQMLAAALESFDNGRYDGKDASAIRSFKELAAAERQREALWAESVRRYNLRRAADRRDAWIWFHRKQIERYPATLEALVARHEAAIALLGGD